MYLIKHQEAVFATHAHPDHYWGMGAIADAFPNARCYMLPYDLKVYNSQYQPKLDEWADIIGESNLCRRQCVRIEPLTQGFFELDGERLEIVERVMGDLKWNSMVWIPSIKTLYASEVFKGGRPWDWN